MRRRDGCAIYGQERCYAWRSRTCDIACMYLREYKVVGGIRCWKLECRGMTSDE